MRKAFWKKPLADFDFWKDPGDAQFYPDIAEWACAFFPANLTLTTAEWAGRPFQLGDWQQQLVGHLFGWIRPDGTRRFRKLFLYVPRKNGKTELASGLGIVFFVADDEPGAEVYCGALTIPQANIFFQKTKKMVKASPALASRLNPPRGRTNRTLFDEQTGSQLMVLASDGDAAQGFNCSCAVIDEVHTLPDGSFSGALQESMGSRRQPMTIMITTAADAGDSFCNSELDYCEKVLDGTIKDPSLMPILFRAKPEDNPGDPRTWEKCNPSLGITVKKEYIAEQWNRMRHTASGIARFKRYYLNCQTIKVSSWLSAEYFDKTACKLPDEVNLAEIPCIAAVDRAIVYDITAVTLYWPELRYFKSVFIVPRATAEDNMGYDQWAKLGLIRLSEFDAISDDEVFELLADLKREYLIEKVAYDPWRMSDVAKKAGASEPDGLGLEMVAVRQSFMELSAPTNELEIMFRNGTIRHDGDPVLRWMFGNCRVDRDHKDNIKLVKENKNSPKKIDGIICLVMCIRTAGLEPEKPVLTEGISWQ